MQSLNFLRDEAGRRFAVLCGFLLIVFLTGGGSRADIQSLPLLRPLAVIVCAFAVFGLSTDQLRRFRIEIGFFAFCFLILLMHATPLPAVIWKSIPGHDLLSAADAIAGIGDIWRPLSIMPDATWNAFYSMFVPLAVFLLMIGLPVEQRQRVLLLLVASGGLCAILGILQVIGPPGGPLYFYKVHSRGLATGLFANRNHTAFFLAMMYPMLAVLAMRGKTENSARLHFWLCLVAAASFAPVILVAGSRLGLGIALLNLVVAALLYRKPVGLRRRRDHQRPYLPYLSVGAAAIAVGLAGIGMTRTTAIDRLLGEAASEDLRFSIWGPTLEAAWAYLPFGSGIGTFAETFAIFEPQELLGPEYVNHAHNDYLEILATAGIPGALAVLLALLVIAMASVRAWKTLGDRRNGRAFPALGSAIVGSLLMASVFDYPLRTPILASVFVIGLVWLRSETVGESGKTIYRGRGPDRSAE